MANLIEISIIWAWDPNAPEVVWAVDAWDEYSIEENESDWKKAIKKAESDNPEIKIVRFTTDADAIVKLFKPAHIPATREED